MYVRTHVHTLLVESVLHTYVHKNIMLASSEKPTFITGSVPTYVRTYIRMGQNCSKNREIRTYVMFTCPLW